MAPPKKRKTTKKAPVKRKNSTRKKTKKKSTFKGFLIKWGMIGFLFGVALLALFFGLVRMGVFGPIPSYYQLESIKNPVASEVFSADGKLLGRYYIQNRSRAEFDEISKNVLDALIATEDARFYEHKGIDEWALLRVFVKTLILQDRSAGGGSTLSQQVAKNIYGRNDLGVLSMPVAKFREGIIAYRLEKIYSKDEILTLYLNTVPFGENTYGIETAAERFFSKTPGQLNVAEAAVLVGMLKANSTYNPRLNPEKSLVRRNVVINQMVKENYLTKEEGEKWKATPLDLHYKKLTYNTGLAAYFREMLRPELERWCSKRVRGDGSVFNLYTDGLRIHTTIDSRMQRYAEEAVKEHMSSLQKLFEAHWKSGNPYKNGVLDRAVRNSERYKKLKHAGFNQQQIDKAFSTPVETQLFSWQGSITKNITPLDSVKYSLLMLHTGFLAMNPDNGDVKAWVGGNDFQYYQYDHVTSSRQVGSVFKPIVFAAALENGISCDEYISNSQKIYTDFKDWSPANSDGMHEGYYSMEGALAHSVNTVAVKVLMETGFDEVIETARDFGITATLPEVPSLALGVADISLLEMVTAYCVFANQGLKVEPTYITRIEDVQGTVLENFNDQQRPMEVMERENARIMNHYLQAVVDSGTSRSIRTQYGITGAIAGKTGTTQNHVDGWFIGYTPSLVVGSWTGAEDPSIHFRTITYGQGAKMALPAVGLFYRKLQNDRALAGYNQKPFEQPSQHTLRMLDQPHWREDRESKPLIDTRKIKELFEVDEESGKINLFKSDPDKREARKKAREERRKARREKRED